MNALVEREYKQFQRSPAWELRNIRKALNLMTFLNGPVENARLEAVELILKERKAR